MQSVIENVHFAREIARMKMQADALRGVSIGEFRKGVINMCEMMSIPAPDDVLAWVCEGNMSDKDVKDWSLSFSLGRA